MLSEYNTEGIVCKPHDDVSECIVCMRVCGRLFAKIDKHTLQLFWSEKVLNKLYLRLLQGGVFVHLNK
jgi:hypothetical protein